MSYLRSGEWRVSGTGKLPMTELLRGSPPGNAGVPPAQHRQSLAHCLDPGRPARAPRLCFGRAHAVPTGRMDGCAIAGKPSGNPRERMRAGRPRSRVGRFGHDCPSRESRRKRTGWMVALNPDLTIPSCPFVDYSFSFCLFSFVSNNWRGGSQGAATGGLLSIALNFRYSAAGPAKQELRVSPWLRSDCNI